MAGRCRDVPAVRACGAPVDLKLNQHQVTLFATALTTLLRPLLGGLHCERPWDPARWLIGALQQLPRGLRLEDCRLAFKNDLTVLVAHRDDELGEAPTLVRAHNRDLGADCVTDIDGAREAPILAGEDRPRSWQVGRDERVEQSRRDVAVPH